MKAIADLGRESRFAEKKVRMILTFQDKTA